MEHEVGTCLLASILSKRGETIKDQDLNALVTWAREHGFLKYTSLLFSTEEWREVGNKLWLSTTEGGKEGKEAKALGLTWRAVTNTLAEMKAERTVAAAAMEALGGGGSRKEGDRGLMEHQPDTRAESRVAQFFGLTAGTPIKGTAAPVRSLGELLDAAGKEVTPPKSEGEMAAKAEVQAPGPGGWAQASKGETSGPSSWPKAAERHPPLPDSGSSSNSEAASTALLPAETEPARAAGDQPQEEENHREMMHEVIKKLAELSTRQDTLESKVCETTPSATWRPMAPPVKIATRTPTFLSGEPGTVPTAPPFPQGEVQLSPPSTPTVRTVPLRRRWNGVIRDAIIESDWHAMDALTCPVLIQGDTAKCEPHDWKLLQPAQQTVTTHGLRSKAARSILEFIFTPDVLCPNDCISIAQLLLTPSQFLLWKQTWKQLAQEEASKHQGDTQDPLYAIQADMLTGSGAYRATVTQLTMPTIIHQLSQTLAHKALLSVPEKKKSPP
ncbi:uncharacterized protein [Aphelocoma coerulescens]|uniref:uncharacterized protein n=1 Tax=Aphelocoma coerulescens TaxID=39617 RepID=UPI003604EFFA